MKTKLPLPPQFQLPENELELPNQTIQALEDPIASISHGLFQVLKFSTQKRNNSSKKSYSNSEKAWKRLTVKTDLLPGKVIKFFSPETIPRRFYYQIWGDPLKKTVHLTKQLERLKILSPKIDAYGAFKTDKLFSHSFIIMEDISHLTPLKQLIDSYKPSESKEYSFSLCHYLATKLSQAHKKNFYHKNIEPYHIYLTAPSVKQVNEDTPWLWIDLDGSTISKDSNLKLRAKNIVSIWRRIVRPYTLTTLPEFLDQYQVCSLTPNRTMQEISRKVFHLCKREDLKEKKRFNLFSLEEAFGITSKERP